MRSSRVNDSPLIKYYSEVFHKSAIKLINEQYSVISDRSYLVEENDDRSYKIYCRNQKDGPNNMVVLDGSNLFTCSCTFYSQHNLPCRHIMFLLDTLAEYYEVNKLFLCTYFYFLLYKGRRYI